jgi:hypothetical protein
MKNACDVDARAGASLIVTSLSIATSSGWNGREFRRPAMGIPGVFAQIPDKVLVHTVQESPPALTFLEYCARNFEASARNRLAKWYDALGEEPDLRLIRRNLDRECHRQDIREPVWKDFLLEIARLLAPGDQIEEEAYHQWLYHGRIDGGDWYDWLLAETIVVNRSLLAPLASVDSAIRNNPGRFVLAGREVPSLPDRLTRYMRFEDFAINNLKLLPIPLEGKSHHGVSMIQRGAILGKHMEGTFFGKPGSPVWCTDASMATEDDVHTVRNRLGMKDVNGGYLVELAFSPGLLEHPLQAPTQVDASVPSASNWIFVKNRTDGGPDWGYTVEACEDRTCRKGVPEAVHAPFRLQPGLGATIGLRVLGPLQKSFPMVTYDAMLSADDL